MQIRPALPFASCMDDAADIGFGATHGMGYVVRVELAGAPRYEDQGGLDDGHAVFALNGSRVCSTNQSPRGGNVSAPTVV